MPGVLDKILDYQKQLSEDNAGNLRNIIQGNLWKKLKVNFGEKYTLPLVIYFDDIQIGNALGSHATFSKLGAVYYTIPTIPPQYSSKPQNIFVAEIFHAVDRSMCSNEITFKMLLTEIQSLEKQGLLINTGTRLQKIGFCVLLVTGNNGACIRCLDW